MDQYPGWVKGVNSLPSKKATAGELSETMKSVLSQLNDHGPESFDLSDDVVGAFYHLEHTVCVLALLVIWRDIIPGYEALQEECSSRAEYADIDPVNLLFGPLR